MNFEQKYLKYKSKYNQLKCQLKGGACNPAPNPNDNEYISFDQYQNIPVARLETIGNHCYDIVQLANWIHTAVNASYPATGLPMSLNDKWNVITAYNAYRTAHNPALPNHFIFTPAQSAQIIAALANPPVPFAITNLINTIRRGAPPLAPPPAPLAPPVAYIRPFIVATPAQIILFGNIIPIAQAALIPGTRYIEYDIRLNRYYRTQPFMNINAADGFVRFGNAIGSQRVNPIAYRYYNEADLIANGIPLPP
jgi:hypothetical protein